MSAVRRTLAVLAALQALSTLVGAIQLIVVPEWYESTLDGTAFAGRHLLAALLLGLVVGGAQWAALTLHVRRSSRYVAGHALAGLVMLGWIAGECLVLDSFIWPHALWGGLGAVQLFLVTVMLGAFRPQPPPPRRRG